MAKHLHHIPGRRAAALIALSSACLPALVMAIACDGASDGSAPLTPGDAIKKPTVVRGETPDDGGVHGDGQVLDFLQTASDGAIERAKLAAAKATSQAVKDFAAVMIADHRAMGERIRDIARRKGITPSPTQKSKELTNDSAATIEKLNRLKGASFDRNYLEEEIILQLKQRVILDRTIEPVAVDPDVARAVTDAHDTANELRDSAQEVLRAVRADAGPEAPESTSTSTVTSSSPDASPPAQLEEAGVGLD